jgi:hypothetical protein
MQIIDPLHRWSGRLPATCLKLLPVERRDHRLACITDAATWTSIWHQWRGEATQPRINFSSQFVALVHNVRYVNRIRFQSASIDDGVLTIESIETRTARPIDDEMYCLVMVFETDGVVAISDGSEVLPVPSHAKA